MRNITRSQNMMNSQKQPNRSSKYKGVYWNKEKKLWQAQIRTSNGAKYLGRKSSEEAAAKLYNTAALKYFGEFAKLNEIKK